MIILRTLLCQADMSLIFDSFTPYDKNAKFYRAQTFYKLLSELHRMPVRCAPPFFSIFYVLPKRVIFSPVNYQPQGVNDSLVIDIGFVVNK
jgi:hypothetical protein